MRKYLSGYKEEMPLWLDEYQPGTPITFTTVMSGRTGYYPGSGFDGHLLTVANRAHCVHSFLYTDYGISEESLDMHLSERDCVVGYHILDIIKWEEKDMLPDGRQQMDVAYGQHTEKQSLMKGLGFASYCKTIIFERNTEKDESWGARRFALTFLCEDGIDFYYQLYVRTLGAAPWLFLLQDHGFGGNYDRFGEGGLLNVIIRQNRCYPEFVICARNTRIWAGYELTDTESEEGGMHKHPRNLYRCIRT